VSIRGCFYFIEIVGKIFRVEFAFDDAVAAKQATISDVIPFRY
jgi:hypothetical protein